MSSRESLTLNAEQLSAFRAVQNGKNIFLTGAGGTGKTHTIRTITDWARTAGIRYAVTAMTGCAALLLGLGAKTLHSWAGVGLARETPHELAKNVQANKRAKLRWLETHLLIIDEVSMMTAELLDKLDLVARRVRKQPERPFGGLQVVFAGDFCQLPPVQKGSPSHGSASSTIPTVDFVFESLAWKDIIQEVHYLHQIVRQNDPIFQKLLEETRLGIVSPQTQKTLEERMNLPWQENEIRPTLLFTRNAEVDAVNRRNMEVLEGERRTYVAETVVMEKVTKKAVPLRDAAIQLSDRLISPYEPEVQTALEKLDTDAPYEKELELCVGAQVMLLVNMDQDIGLVNGSRGVVTGYTPGGLPCVKFLTCPNQSIIVDRSNWWLTDYEGIGRSQIPLKVAYAITIHKSQGATLDSALVDIGSSTFEYGQAYVALSRVRSLFGLYVWKFDPRRIMCHPKVKAFYEALGSSTSDGNPTVEQEVVEAQSQSPVVREKLQTFKHHSEPTPEAEISSVAGDYEPSSRAGWAEDSDPTPPTESPWLLDELSVEWKPVVESYMESAAGQRLQEMIRARSAIHPTAPHREDVFAVLRHTPNPADIRIVILGQDPYHTFVTGTPIAHGLAFSVRDTNEKLPPSLVNIYKEIASDLEIPYEPKKSGDLTRWATQGVFLLNDVLTVSAGQPLSHASIGWEDLTTRILTHVLQKSPHVVILAWGRNAQKKLDHPIVKPHLRGHTILKAPHPSPLSAHSGFFGSRPFSQANAALLAHNQTAIDWS